MASFSWFGIGAGGSSETELPDVFPMPIVQSEFVCTDVRNIYAKILTDAVERTQGIPPKLSALLWDNCLQSESSKGLISLLAGAMESKAELFLILDETTSVLRKATADEEKVIKTDYEKKAKSELGIFVSFKEYKKTDMVKLYSALEYFAISALNKNLNLSKAIQYKMADLRGSVSLTDSAAVKAQGVSMAANLRDGKDILTDAKDIIETAKPDITPVKEALMFIDNKRCFYLGMPMSYVDGEQTGGIGSTGEGDARAVERGLKLYYFSILKPVIEELFSCKTSYKSQDFRLFDSGFNALKAFELSGERYITAENKQAIVESLFGLEEQDIDQEAMQAEEDQDAADQAKAAADALKNNPNAPPPKAPPGKVPPKAGK